MTKQNTVRENVVRATVFGPVMAIIRVDKGAEPRSFPGSLETYFACKRFIPGGVIEMYIFGDIEAGKRAVCQVELKTRTVKGKTTHYIRAEVAPGEKSDHRLYAGTPDDPNVFIDFGLPHKVIEEYGRACLVGFISR